MGAPADEYNTQIDHIVSLMINKKPSKEILESELLKIFKTDEFELERRQIKELANIINNYMKI